MLLVADGGAVRFEVPSGWHHGFHTTPTKAGELSSIRICDVPPPHDNCRIEVSVYHVPIMDIDAIPLEKLLPTLDHPDTQRVRRPAHKLAWRLVDSTEPDKNEGREMWSFLAYAMYPGVQALLTMALWKDDLELRLPIWQHILSTFDMGQRVLDPTTGAVTSPHLN